MRVGNGLDGYDVENLSDELESSEGSNDITTDHVSNVIVHEEEHSVIQNPYYGIEDEDIASVRASNSTMKMDEIEKLKIVNNIYYE